MSAYRPGTFGDTAFFPKPLAAALHVLTEPRLPPPALSADCALFLDVDGCLLDFADDPADVRASPELIACLQAVSEKLAGALALVSGRRIDMLDQMFAPASFPAAGLHGLERRASGDVITTINLAAATPDHINAIATAARGALAEHPGAGVEDKGSALALHWRAAPEAEAAAMAFAHAALPGLPGYRLQPGDHVVELRPDASDKGAAIAAFMEEAPFRGRMPVFAGDDLTDEDGFAWINAKAGVSILVGDRSGSGARYRLADVAAVRGWLEAFA